MRRGVMPSFRTQEMAAAAGKEAVPNPTALSSALVEILDGRMEERRASFGQRELKQRTMTTKDEMMDRTQIRQRRRCP